MRPFHACFLTVQWCVLLKCFILHLLSGSQLDCWTDFRMVSYKCGIATIHSKFLAASSDWGNITKVSYHILSCKQVVFKCSLFVFVLKTSQIRGGMNTHTPTCQPCSLLSLCLSASTPHSCHLYSAEGSVSVAFLVFYWFWQSGDVQCR